MRRSLRFLKSTDPLLGLSDATTRRLHWFAFVWSVVTIVGLSLATRLDWVNTRPGRSAFPLTIQPVFMVVFAIAVVVAWKWEIIGGTVAAFAATGLAVFAVEQLELVPAIGIVASFLLPGLIWMLIDLHDFRPATALGAVTLIGVAVTAGGLVAHDVHEGIFGPTHPQSSTPAIESPADWIWAGAVTEQTATVTARIPGDEPVQLVVTTPSVTAPFVVSGDRDEHDIVRFFVSGLSPDTDYSHALSIDGSDPEPTGQFRTFPAGAGSFTVAFSSCARVGSNGAVFDAIAANNPLVYLVTGDLHYANIATDDAPEMREVLDYTLSRPAPAALYRSTAVGYVWDDHDYGGDGSDSTSISRTAAQATYRSYVPHYPLQDDIGPIHQAFTVGRVRFILTDGRSDRTPASAPDDETKTLLGTEQKAWLKAELRSASETHGLIVWVNPVPWIAEPQPAADHWGGYTSERREIADFIADHDIDNLLMVSGDAHMLAIDDGTNSDYSSSQAGAFPVVHAAALDRPGKVKGGPYSHGAVAGSGQFVLMSVTDTGRSGTSISVEISGRNWTNQELLSYSFELAPPTPSQ